MNKRIVTEDKRNRDWTRGASGDRYYVQQITLDFAGRTEEYIAQAWVEKLSEAITADWLDYFSKRTPDYH